MTTPTSPIRGIIQMASHTAAYWTNLNPVLLLGQIGIETDTRKMKSGDGVTTWNLLGYVTGTGGAGGGASLFTDLTDAATAALPTTNAPLSTALGLKAPLASPAFTGTPTGITKTHVGLGNVDNTTDATKPVSAPQAAALALKIDTAGGAFTGPVTGLNSGSVGLGSVNNTSDLAKPISTATATALAAKQAALIAGSGITIDGTNTISATSGASAQQIAYSATIPLDTAGNGKFMTAHQMTGNVVLAVGSSPVEQGNCNFSIIGDGSSSLTVSAFTNGNGYSYVATNGANNIYSAIYTYGTPLLYGVQGATVPVLPGQVTGLTLGTSTATTQPLTWSAPSTGGTPTDYLIEYKAASSGTWLVFADGVSTALSGTVTGLVNSTSYNYRVSASNAAGTGTASATGTGSTLFPPGQVTGLTAGTATSTTQPLTWTVPGAGGITADYVVEYKTTAGSTWLTFPDGVSATPSATVTGLVASTSYDYRVTATNGAGSGTVSATITATTAAASGKITFTDTFTGADASAPNARWTGDQAGWEIHSNTLRFTGSSYSYILTPCTAGSNTIDVDIDFSGAGLGFGGVVISYVDANNQAWVLLNGSEELRVGQTVAGVSTDLVVDTGHNRIGGGLVHLQVVYNNSTGIATVAITGGVDPGSFSNVTAINAAARSGTKIGCAMNTGKPPNIFDNFQLS